MKPLTLHIKILAGWDVVTTQKHLGFIQQRLAMLFASPWDWQSWFQCRLWCNVFALGYFYLHFPFECSTLWGKKHSRMGFSLYTLLENFLWKTEIFTGYYGFNRIYIYELCVAPLRNTMHTVPSWMYPKVRWLHCAKLYSYFIIICSRGFASFIELSRGMVNASFWPYQESSERIVHLFQIQPKWAETLCCTTIGND